MRLVFSAATALVAVFASSVATSTGVNANALLKSDVALVARVANGDDYDADTQRRLRDGFDDDESALSMEREERTGNAAVIVEEAAPKLGRVLSGTLHAGETGEAGAVKAAETAAAQGKKVEEAKAKWTLTQWVKTRWANLMKWINERHMYKEFMKWIQTLKNKHNHGKPKTEDAAEIKKTEAAGENAGTAAAAATTRDVAPNGPANANGHATAEVPKPAVAPEGASVRVEPKPAVAPEGASVRVEPKPAVAHEEAPVRVEPKPAVAPEEAPVRVEPKPSASVESPPVIT